MTCQVVFKKKFRKFTKIVKNSANSIYYKELKILIELFQVN